MVSKKNSILKIGFVFLVVLLLSFVIFASLGYFDSNINNDIAIAANPYTTSYAYTVGSSTNEYQHDVVFTTEYTQTNPLFYLTNIQ